MESWLRYAESLSESTKPLHRANMSRNHSLIRTFHHFNHLSLARASRPSSTLTHGIPETSP